MDFGRRDKKMTYARFHIDKRTFDALEKSVPIEVEESKLNTTWVYAPKSRIIVESEYKVPMTTSQIKVVILVPWWVFRSKGLYASNGTGYIDSVEIEK